MRIVALNSIKHAIAIAISLLTLGCASVPKEAVELSYQIGQDLDILYKSYDLMIVDRFAGFRKDREEYLEKEWIPVFLSDFVKRGQLVETARGDVVWSDQADDFVAPTPGKEEAQLLATIMDWSNVAVTEIRLKKQQLIDPLNEQEALIRGDIGDAFNRLQTANAHITAHLNSIRKVEKVNSEALDRFGLSKVVSRINDTIVKVSEEANSGLEAFRRADGFIDDVDGSSSKFAGSVKGEG